MIEADTQPGIVADIVMLNAFDGGRSRGISIDDTTRYMPHLAIDDRANRKARTDENNLGTEHYMGVLFRPSLSIVDPATGSGRYPLTLMYHPRVDYTTLVCGATFSVREGGRIVGHGVVVSGYSTPTRSV
ncbi:hypothetical protein SAMN06265222_12926 [Neorhodopirellula lusitana]|uniref:Uncharacterized protein n=1 Tax=Neorhodopirellula lusitana TaxID=445327 RepID=A0ABY1QVS3_9BACT|nr:hypothetical protein [Neorhodopirellula lusitana]SMP79157.1 hypothetical protein SAMN06265222_12926 [Neorhodopirellula lusitana]